MITTTARIMTAVHHGNAPADERRAGRVGLVRRHGSLLSSSTQSSPPTQAPPPPPSFHHLLCDIFYLIEHLCIWAAGNVFPTYLVGSPLTRLELDEKAMQVDPNVTPRCNVHQGTTPSRLRTTLFTKIQQCAARVGSLWVIWVRLCCTTPAPGWHASSRTFERHSKHLGDKLVSGRDNLNEVQQVLCTRGTASSQEEKSILGLKKIENGSKSRGNQHSNHYWAHSLRRFWDSIRYPLFWALGNNLPLKNDQETSQFVGNFKLPITINALPSFPKM